MKIRIVWVKSTRGRSPHMEALAEDYAKRIRQYSPVELAEFKSETALLEAQHKEKDRNPRAVLVLLERTGKKLTSFDLAEFIREQREFQASTLVTFAVGPADGFTQPAWYAADLVLSFGPITLPHDLARVVLLEQVYRAFTILRGHPYHGGH
jgi:23S rRNA (pseudouridine1915-N3)-methyltransferase